MTGFSLPMLLCKRIFMRFLFGAAVVCTAFAATHARAQSSVETYTDRAVPTYQHAEGVLPEGMQWNSPLKPGSLVLSSPTKKKEAVKPSPKPEAKSFPIGELKAPQIQKTTEPPLMSSSKSSSASVMLIQGMKNALQQIGQNPELPESLDSALSSDDNALESNASSLVPPLLKAADSRDVSGKPSSEIAYEPGQSPVDLATGKPIKIGETGKKVGDDTGAPSVDRSLAPSIDSGSVDVSMPKATEISEPPVALEKVASEKASGKSADAPKQESAKPARKSRGLFGSIFGFPVEPEDEKEAVEASVRKVSPEAEAVVSERDEKKGVCEPKVMSWTKECRLAGYPASYSGQIVGETRTECPSGEVKDVWLSNTCAPLDAAKDSVPRATEIAAQPKTLAESADLTVPPPMLPDKTFESAKPLDKKGNREEKELEAKGVTLASASSLPPADTRVDANCGAANGLPAEAKPVADLCLAGTSGEVLGEGPWLWTCTGLHGGITVSCAAPLAKGIAKTAGEQALSGAQGKPGEPQDGKCGEADGVGADNAPEDNLCAKGIPSRVNGGGPWTWACSGLNGGQAAACGAPKKSDGVCGKSSSSGVESRPDRDLCAAGFASAVSGDGPWHWTCSGIHGGAPVMCSAAPKVNAVCGPASLSGHRSVPTEGLCKNGEATAVEGDGPWTWSCSGEQGGATVPCRAPVMADGVCGLANGQGFADKPKDDLCQQGSPTRVTGQGPWHWNCSGLDGGSTVSCTAALTGKAVDVSGKKAACGPAVDRKNFQAPAHDLCAGGRPSAVIGDGPWTWSCADSEGHDVACIAYVAQEGACGKAANVPSADAPLEDLCDSGFSGEVKADKGKKHWSWQCRGAAGGAAVSCSAPMVQKGAHDAKCGSAHGRGHAKAPTSDLCFEGKVANVRGDGPWTWQCVAKSGGKSHCEAPRIVDGVCGSANGSIQKSLPLTGLCAAGSPTDVDGTGPWLWSCIGVGGGSSVSCSAAAQSQAKVDGTCGAAANGAMTSAPAVNLCDSGVPSAVHGEGPWTWTCSGLNGGIASTCATGRVVPKAPPPPGPPVNAVCGPANGVAAVRQPVDGLCSSGTATNVSGDGPWNWNCLGGNGGMTVSCTSPLMPPAPIEGVCGGAHGVTTLVAPKSGLCAAGIASAVSGSGPWTWSCSGTNGGGAVSCVAPLAGKGGAATGYIPSPVSPSQVYAPDAETEAPAPKAAPVGLVTPRLPTGPLPPLETGSLPQLKPSAPLDRPLEASQMPQKGFAQGARQTQLPPDENETLPSGQKALTPPPIRDTVKPSPSLKPPAIDQEGKLVPGARIELDPDVATLSFARGSDALDKDAVKALDKLSDILREKVAVRITLHAYAATTGQIAPREARRISLSRALAIRDYLTNKGISSGRIDVRALGANVPSGDMDRVDVKVN